LEQLRNAFVKRHHSTPLEGLSVARSHRYWGTCVSRITMAAGEASLTERSLGRVFFRRYFRTGPFVPKPMRQAGLAGNLYGRALGLTGGAESLESTAMAERSTSLVKKNFPSFGTIMIRTLSESR